MVSPISARIASAPATTITRKGQSRVADEATGAAGASLRPRIRYSNTEVTATNSQPLSTDSWDSIAASLTSVLSRPSEP